MAEEFKKRNTAFKISIGLLLGAMKQIHFDENQRFRFLELNGKEIYRINLIASIIDKFESNQKQYINITLDDGTGNIRVKTFADSIHLLQNLQLGDTVLVIGVLRHYNDELYIMPEIIKTIDSKWLVARKLELEDEYGELYSMNKDYEIDEIRDNLNKKDTPLIETDNPIKSNLDDSVDYVKVENPENTKTFESSSEELVLREKIMELVKNSENDGGIDIEKLILSMKDPVDKINKEVTELLEEGSMYEPKPGRLRIL